MSSRRSTGWQSIIPTPTTRSPTLAVSAVAGIAADVTAVAGIDDDVSALALIAADITTAAANIADIKAAPGAAVAASDSADLSAAWAEGHEPGGAGTKSAKEWAGEAEADAVTAAATTQMRYAPGPIRAASGIGLGGYICDRRAYRASVQDRVIGAIIDADPGAELTFYFAVDGTQACGPFTATVDAPVDVAVSYAVGIGKSVDVYITHISGVVREFDPASYGAVS